MQNKCGSEIMNYKLKEFAAKTNTVGLSKKDKTELNILLTDEKNLIEYEYLKNKFNNDKTKNK